MDWRRAARWAALTGLALSVLTACTVSVSGGLLGALASIGLAMVVFLLAGATQTGCAEDEDTVGPCLSYIADGDIDASATDGGVDGQTIDMAIGPCLSPDAHIGPCLSPPEPDFGPDMPIGPCLSPPEPDRGVDMEIGPCLSPPAPDFGVDMEIGPCLDIEPDMGVDAAPEQDAHLGPCLSPPPPEPDPEDGSGKAPAVDKAAIFDKVAANLPADLAARLKKHS